MKLIRLMKPIVPALAIFLGVANAWGQSSIPPGPGVVMYGSNGDGTYSPFQTAAASGTTIPPGPAFVAYGQNTDKTYSALNPTGTFMLPSAANALSSALQNIVTNASVATVTASSLTLSGLKVSGGTLSGATTLPGGGTITSGGQIGIGQSPNTAISISQNNGFTSQHGMLELVSGSAAGHAGPALSLNAVAGGGSNWLVGSADSNDGAGAGFLQFYLAGSGVSAKLSTVGDFIAVGQFLSVGNIFSVLSLTTWADNHTCTAGQMTWDASFIYVCTATNTVKRATLATF